MQATQIAWAVGLFEGEGCITVNKCGTKFLQLTMCDKDIVTRFHNIVDCGKFYTCGPTCTGKPKYRVSIHRKADVHKTLELFLPLLGDRRAHKALDVLDILECS